MSTGTRERRQLLVFPSPASLVGFLLTCMEDSRFGVGSEIYEKHLSRIAIPKGKGALIISLRGDVELVRQLVYMAIANGGKSENYQPLPKEKHNILTLDQLLRAVRLQAVTVDPGRIGHLLIGLYKTGTSAIAGFLKHLWTLGATGVEVAFVKSTSRSLPTQLIRIFGMQYSDAFRAWCESSETRIELYVPMRSDRADSKFYTMWGYRHPVPGLERISAQDRELVLLRPKQNQKPVITEWITFAEGSVNFFRKSHEFVDLEVERKLSDPLVLEEESEPDPVPIELAIVNKPRVGVGRVWQLDKQIDRQRRELQELEQHRSRLAAGERDEVYFAYRYDQPARNQLNPRLVQLLQQRIGVLNHYDYAFCAPANGQPYHLIVSNRTQRQVGFSLQPADSVYYQPAFWRRWGVNLFLPFDTELAPRIDDNDALPILQKLLEQSGEESNGSPSVFECSAILWHPGSNGSILETRVAATAPLLSQFRILNGFQRNVAARVHEETKQELGDQLNAIRSEIDRDIDEITQKLLEYVAQRTSSLDDRYSKLEKSLVSAQELVDAFEPKIEDVRQFILELPNEWVEFVKKVISTHRTVADPELIARVKFREQISVTRDQLRALSLRRVDFSKVVAKHQGAINEKLGECDELVSNANQQQGEVAKLYDRGASVFRQVSRLHAQMNSRLEKVRRLEKKAKNMEKEIDGIEAREAEVDRRIGELTPLYQEYQNKAAELETLRQDTQGREQTLARKSADLAREREDLRKRTLQIATQLEHIEAHLCRCLENADELDASAQLLQDQMDLVDAHAEAISLWGHQESTWQRYIESQHQDAGDRIEQLRHSVEQLEQDDAEAETIQKHLKTALEQISKAEKLMQK